MILTRWTVSSRQCNAYRTVQCVCAPTEEMKKVEKSALLNARKVKINMFSFHIVYQCTTTRRCLLSSMLVPIEYEIVIDMSGWWSGVKQIVQHWRKKKEGSIRSLQWRVIHSHILLCVQHDFSISHTTRFLFAALFQGIWISRVLVRLESGEATAAQAKIYDHRRNILYILNAHAKATKKEYRWNTMHDLEVNISCAAASNTVLITCVFVYCYASLLFCCCSCICSYSSLETEKISLPAVAAALRCLP